MHFTGTLDPVPSRSSFAVAFANGVLFGMPSGHTLVSDKQIVPQSGEQASVEFGVNTPLLFTPDDVDQFATHANV